MIALDWVQLVVAYLLVSCATTVMSSSSFVPPQAEIITGFAGDPAGPHDVARMVAQPQPQRAHEMHPATMRKMGLAGLATACTPALFEVRELEHPTKTAVFKFGAMSAKDVLGHVVSQLSSVQFTNVPTGPMHNVDGREGDPVVATPGADAGELLLAINAFETLSGHNLTESQVGLFLFDYLVSTDVETLGLQMEEEALNKLCEGGCCPPSCRIDATPRSDDDRNALLEHILLPDSQGSAHFKHLLQHPLDFSTRQDLTKAFLASFFRLLWGQPAHQHGQAGMELARSKLRLWVPRGPHRETALLQLRTGACRPAMTPMIAPETQSGSIFLLNEDAAQHRRALNAEWLAHMRRKMQTWDVRASDADMLVRQMEVVASKQYTAALKLDGGRTPLFSLDWPAACCAPPSPPSLQTKK